jgi:hypothetical protein
MTSLRKNAGPLAWLGLFAAALVAFVLLNEPLFHMVTNLRPLGIALAVVLSFCGIGGPIARRLRLGTTWVGEILISFSLGMGLTGLLVFFLGIAGIVQPGLYAAWTLAGFALFAVSFVRRRELPKVSLDLSGPFNVLGLILIVVFVVQLLPPLAAPEVSTDALEYHLLIPKIYLSQGRIGPLPAFLESNYPSLVQYVYLFIMSWAGDAACKAFHFWGGALLLLAVWRLARRIKPSASLLAPALVLGMPVANVVFGWAWNDAFFAFFAVAALVSLLESDPEGGKGGTGRASLLAAGLYAGLAGWTKYTMLMLLPALLALVLWRTARRRWKVREAAWFAVPAMTLAALVLVKNAIWTGNPVYPFLSGIFPSPQTNEAAAGYFVRHGLQRLEIPDWNWSTYFLFPFRMTFTPALVDIHPGLFPLLFLPFLFVKSVRRGTAFLKAFVAATAAFWLFVFQTGTRSLLATLAVLIVIGAVGLEDLVAGRRAFRRAAVVFIAAAAAANLGLVLVTNYFLTRPVPYFIGKEDRASYLRREAEAQPVYEWLNANPGVGGVLLVGLHKPYYLDRPFFSSGIGDVPLVEILIRDARTVDEIRAGLVRLGVTHVAIDRALYDRENRLGLFSWTNEKKALFETFLQTGCSEEAVFGARKIYRAR